MNDENAQTHQEYKETELGILPETWRVIRFGDKGVFQYGYTTSATKTDTGTKFLRISDIRNDGSIDWNSVPYGDISADDLQKFKLREGDLLFARIGATTGKTCIMRRKVPSSIFASYLIRFVPNEEVNPYYMFYFTQTRNYWKLVNAGKEGKLKKGLSASELKGFLCPLPPIQEQGTIAHVLQVIQEAKEKTEEVIRAIKELKKSMMKHLFTYGPVSSEEAERVKLKETEIGMMPEDWGKEIVKSLVEKTGQIDPRKKPNQRFRYVDVSGINRETLRIQESQEIRGEDAPSRARKLMKKSDVIFATVRPTLKRLAFIHDEYDGQVCSTAFCVLRAKEKVLASLYLFYALQRDTVIADLGKIQKGASYPAVTDSEVKNQYIPLPQIRTQQQIAEILSSIDAKIEAEESKRNALEGLFKTLLHDLMTAKIRVNNLPLEA